MNMETAARSVKEFNGKPEMYTNTNCTVHRMRQNSSQEQGVACKEVPTCFRCGIRGHSLQVPDRQERGVSPLWQERQYAACLQE